MCTLTFARTPDGYELFFNRDELKTRGAALPPERRERDGVPYLAPTDADAGGTWLGVNARGLTVGILNGWRRRDLDPGDFTSRGLLVASLLDCAGTAEVEGRLTGRDLAEFRSFALVALEPGRPLLRATWTGDDLTVARPDDGEQPISSSSRDPEGAERRRRLLFAGLNEGELPTPDQLEAFHRDHDGGPSALSPCMHREDAETVSSTRVVVRRDEVEMRYHPGAPCLGNEVRTLRLARAPVPAPSRGR